MDSLLNICKVQLNRSFSPFAAQTRTLKNYKSIKGLLGVPPYKGKSLAQKLAGEVFIYLYKRYILKYLFISISVSF